MVIFEDRTGLVRAQAELARERERSEESLPTSPRSSKTRGLKHSRISRTRPTRPWTRCTRSGPDWVAETADRLFRVMHSLKGAARYLEFSGIGHVAHAIEEIIAVCRDKSRPPDTEEAQRLDSLMDAIRTEVGAIRPINERFRQFAVSGGGVEAHYRELMSSLKRMASEIGRDLHKEVNLRAFGTDH